MNYLQLINRLRLEGGISGPDLSSVTGLSGESLRCKTWVAQAWTELQEEHPNWDWLRTSFSFQTVAAQRAYTPSGDIALTDFNSWAEDTFRIYLTSRGTSDEQFLYFREYADFRDLYMFSSFNTTQSRPISFAVRPNDKAILIGPLPDAIYTVAGEYYSSPVELSATTDTPAMPTQYHMAIVYKALGYYGMFESAGEVVQRAQVAYNEVLRKIELDQLQPVTLAGPIA